MVYSTAKTWMFCLPVHFGMTIYGVMSQTVWILCNEIVSIRFRMTINRFLSFPFPSILTLIR